MRLLTKINHAADRALSKLLNESAAKAGCPNECGNWSSCYISGVCSGLHTKRRSCVNSACNSYYQYACC